jgi:hypothetical protein
MAEHDVGFLDLQVGTRRRGVIVGHAPLAAKHGFA